MFYSFAFVMTLACASFWYAAGKQEMGTGFLWAGLSLVVSFAVMSLFDSGVLGVLGAQLVLMLGIALFRVWLDSRQR